MISMWSTSLFVLLVLWLIGVSSWEPVLLRLGSQACVFAHWRDIWTDWLPAPLLTPSLCLLWKEICVCLVLWYHHLNYLVLRLHWRVLHCGCREVDSAFHLNFCADTHRRPHSQQLRKPDWHMKWTSYSHTPKKIAATLWLSHSCGILLELAHVHSYVSMLNSSSPVSLFFLFVNCEH